MFIFWCPKVGSRYRPLEWLIQLTSIFFRVPPNLSVKLPRDCSDVTHHRCCTGKSDYNPKKRRAHKITSCSFCAVRRKERFAQKGIFLVGVGQLPQSASILDPPRKARARSPNLQRTGLIGSVTSRDVTKSVNVVLARWFHFFDAKPKNVHFWCPKLGSRYRPL